MHAERTPGAVGKGRPESDAPAGVITEAEDAGTDLGIISGAVGRAQASTTA